MNKNIFAIGTKEAALSARFEHTDLQGNVTVITPSVKMRNIRHANNWGCMLMSEKVGIGKLIWKDQIINYQHHDKTA